MGAVAFAQSPFSSDTSAFNFGYSEGYRHGVADAEMGLSFDYAHSHRFQSGISINSYTNSNFRSGYIDGYTDGYRRSSDDFDFDEDIDRDDDDLFIDGRSDGFVTVFTNPNFDGSSRAFRVGSYPFLNGALRQKIDSIEVHGPMRVILYEEPDFQGRKLILEQDTFDLDEFNFGDRAESMIIERID
jgi:hypothetical protein